MVKLSNSDAIVIRDYLCDEIAYLQYLYDTKQYGCRQSIIERRISKMTAVYKRLDWKVVVYGTKR